MLCFSSSHFDIWKCNISILIMSSQQLVFGFLGKQRLAALYCVSLPIVLHYTQCSVSCWKVAIPKIEHSSYCCLQEVPFSSNELGCPWESSVPKTAVREWKRALLLPKALFKLPCFLQMYDKWHCRQSLSSLISTGPLLRRAVVMRSVFSALCHCSGIYKLWTNCIKKWKEVFNDH